MKFHLLKKDRLMIVDDEEFCITSLLGMLKQTGFPSDMIDCCITGKEALDQVKLCHSLGINYKVILTDFNMPEMDGLVATQEIRKFLNEKGEKMEIQPIIVGVTGHVQEKFTNMGIESGMQRVISKPLYFKNLFQLLQDFAMIKD
jgi:CheY-like chemotaxis protein